MHALLYANESVGFYINTVFQLIIVGGKNMEKLKVVVLSFCSALLLGYVVPTLGVPFSSRISSQEELETIVQQEKEKLKLTKKVSVVLDSSWVNPTHCGVKKDGQGYEIILSRPYQTRGAVRWGLYLIASGSSDSLHQNRSVLNILKCATIGDTKAGWYATYGIKL